MNEITFEGLVIAALVFFTITSAGLFIVLNLYRQRIRRLEIDLSAVKGYLEAAADSGIGVGRKVISLEKRLRAAEQKQQEIEGTDLQKVSYNEAVRLIGMEANVEDLVNSCGLTRAEANLLEVLHASQNASQIKNR